MIDGCVHDPIPGCATNVPVASGWGRLVLGLGLLAAAGFALASRRSGIAV